MSLVIEKVQKRFADFEALKGVNLTAPDGAFLALLALVTLVLKSLLEWRFGGELRALGH